MSATFRDLTQDEKNMMELYRDMALKICKKYVPGFKGDYTSKLLDDVFASWLKDTDPFVKQNYDMDFHHESEKKPSAYMIKMTLGTVFGDILNKEFQSNWKHVTDMYGEEISVHHAGVNYATFPYSSIEKRIASKELNFFQAIEATMAAQVQKK